MRRILHIAILFALVSFAVAVDAQTPTFTFQGRLTDSTLPAGGTYQMQFSIWDAATLGTQQGTTITNNSVTVTNGVFTVNLDFSPATPFAAGSDRWIEIAVRKPTDPPGFTTLTPRQQITSSPFAIKAAAASSSDSLSAACVLCVTDAQIIAIDGSKVTGTVANATTAVNVSGVVPIANGGTGSATKNFVDLTTSQTIGGAKSFTLLNFGNNPPSGLLGQPLTTVFSTAGVSPGAGFVVIPGLTTSVSMPAICISGSTSCIAYITAEGGVQTTSTSTTGVSRVDIALFIDGVIVPTGGYKRVIAANTGGSTTTIENWSLGYTTTLSSGSHTIAVFAALNSGSAANVGGDSNSVMQGRLTVVFLRQ